MYFQLFTSADSAKTYSAKWVSEGKKEEGSSIFMADLKYPSCFN